MSTIRAVRPLVSALRVLPSYTARTYITRPASVLRTLAPLQSTRFKSEAARSSFAKNPTISYEELKPITEQPSLDVLLLDVREPDEVALGTIPSAVNLPLSELKTALDEHYNPGDFQKKYAFEKPLPKQNIIVFCRSGKRSATAAELAGEKGYHNIRNYTGSWLDWSKREQGKNDDDD